jgi:hypothetical protein
MPDEIDAANIEEYGKKLSIEDLLLDSDNPRLYAQRRSGNLLGLQDQIYNDLMRKSHVPTLKRNILENGTREAIYVQYQNRYEGYVVVEGNTRTAIHKTIVDDGTESDFDFTTIVSNVINPSVSEAELSRMKVIWQLSKQDWGVYEKAALMYEQHYEHGFPIADIARDFNETKAYINTNLAALAYYEEYTTTTSDEDTKKFSFFSKECPAKVRKWFQENNSNKEDYFALINSGRIPSVALSGGLRDFAKFVENEGIMDSFKEDEEMTVLDGCEMLVELDLLASFKWMKHLTSYTSDIYKLMDPTYQSMLKDDNTLRTNIKALKVALSNIIELVEDDE